MRVYVGERDAESGRGRVWVVEDTPAGTQVRRA